MKSFVVATLFSVAAVASPLPAPAPVSLSVFFPFFTSLLTVPQPGIPSASTAVTQLNSLTVKSYVDPGGYSRDLFPHWSTVSGACNTRYFSTSSTLWERRTKNQREYVLKRDGTNVVQDSSCAATSGTWASPYDSGVWTAASDVDIDHMVPLKNAWVVCSHPFFFSFCHKISIN